MRKLRKPNMGGESSNITPFQQLTSENKILTLNIEKLKKEIVSMKNAASRSNQKGADAVLHQEIIINKDNEIENLKKEIVNMKEAASRSSREETGVALLKKRIIDKDNEVEKLKSEIKLLKKTVRNNVTTGGDRDLLEVFHVRELQSVGTQKTFKAIKSEVKNQESSIVQVKRRTLENKYMVNPNQVTPALKILEQYGYIEIISESERKRMFKILKDLPLT